MSGQNSYPYAGGDGYPFPEPFPAPWQGSYMPCFAQICYVLGMPLPPPKEAIADPGTKVLKAVADSDDRARCTTALTGRQLFLEWRRPHASKARFPLPELTGDRFPLPVNTGRVD